MVRTPPPLPLPPGRGNNNPNDGDNGAAAPAAAAAPPQPPPVEQPPAALGPARYVDLSVANLIEVFPGDGTGPAVKNFFLYSRAPLQRDVGEETIW